MRPTTSPPGRLAQPAGLQGLLAVIEAVPHCPTCRTPRAHDCAGDCDPDAYCACCLAECDCPPAAGHWWCAHLRGRAGRVDIDLFGRLLLAADPGAYADRPAPTDVILTPDRAARVELMRQRVASGRSPFGAGQVDVLGFERLALSVRRRRNGSDEQGELGTEEGVRRVA